jgi:hypothetical protein
MSKRVQENTLNHEEVMISLEGELLGNRVVSFRRPTVVLHFSLTVTLEPNQQFYRSDPVPCIRSFRSTGVSGVR